MAKIDAILDDENFLNRVVAAARIYLDADIAFLAEFDDVSKRVLRVAAKSSDPLLREGDEFPLSDTYCQRVVRAELPEAVYDARSDDRVRDLRITKDLGIDAYMGVPVLIQGDRVFGTLCCINFEANEASRGRDLRFMRFLADLIGAQVDREATAGLQDNSKREAIQQVINAGGPRVVFQPVVSLTQGGVVGFEALARFDQSPHRTPDVWFREAWDLGLGVELEMAAVQAALAHLDQVPDNAYLAINVSPLTLLDDRLEASIRDVDSQRIVLEITEHAVVDQYEQLVQSLGRVRKHGTRIAIDDVGAGYSGMRHFLHIRPDIAKLDVSLTRGVEADVAKQTLAAAVQFFAMRTGLVIVAEGIETEAEAETLRSIGVENGQGYLFGRPEPLASERAER